MGEGKNRGSTTVEKCCKVGVDSVARFPPTYGACAHLYFKGCAW
jgi:hypothetical protein